MKRLDQIVLWFGYFGISATVLIFVINVCSRKLGWPLPGSFSIVTMIALFMAVPSIIHVQIQRGHLTIESLTSKYPPRTLKIMETIADIFSLGMWGIAGWLGLKYAAKMWAAKEVTEPLLFPVAPFRFIFAIGLIIMCLVILIQLLPKSISFSLNKNEEKRRERS
jgi:TRAP-type C4-dicarboxylate transport system permease small subunit